jgi:hypothetical protein
MAAIAASNTYQVQIPEDSIVAGKTLKAGDYKIELQKNFAVIKQGKETIEVPAHGESVTKKFASTEIEYTNKNIQEIRVGGSRTKIVFGDANATASADQ